MTLATWLAFFIASWLIGLSPGPGALSCMASGLKFGWGKGLWQRFPSRMTSAIHIYLNK